MVTTTATTNVINTVFTLYESVRRVQTPLQEIHEMKTSVSRLESHNIRLPGWFESFIHLKQNRGRCI